MPPRQPGLNGLPIHIRDGRFICYVRTNTGERKQRALHIRADGSRESERAAVAAYWQEQSKATAGQDGRRRGATKTLRKALDAVMAAQELAERGLDALNKTFYRGRCLTQYFGPDFDLETLNTQQQLVDYAIEARKQRSAATVQMELMVLGQAMRQLGLSRPPLPPLKVKTKPQEPLTEEEQRKFLLAATPKHKLTVLLLMTLGPRRSEVAKIGEVDWDRKTMWIHGTKTKNSNREVPIPDELFEEMLSLRARGEWNGFPKVTGRRILAIVVQTCKRAGIPRRHPNDLRGTASQRLRAAGVDAELRAAIQGNSARMQEQTYTQTHKMVEVMRDALASTKRIKSPSPNASKEAFAAGHEAGGTVESLEKRRLKPA